MKDGYFLASIALVGVTNSHAELEGTEGFFTGQSSAVQAVVSLYGASNLMTILGRRHRTG